MAWIQYKSYDLYHADFSPMWAVEATMTLKVSFETLTTLDKAESNIDKL